MSHVTHTFVLTMRELEQDRGRRGRGRNRCFGMTPMPVFSPFSSIDLLSREEKRERERERERVKRNLQGLEVEVGRQMETADADDAPLSDFGDWRQEKTF